MKWLKLTAYSFLFLSIGFSACDTQDPDFVDQNLYVGTATLSGSNEVPVVVTTATGTVEANYNKLSKILNYKVTWSGLSGNATAAHIHGTAPIGYSVGVLQSFTSFPAATSGTYSGTLFADGIKILEEDILGDKYYVNIHTALRPAGEIRAQIVLRRKF